MNAVEVQQLCYRYARKTEALHEISLNVPRGAIYGLIGPNGAGKSTLLQCCAGLRYAGSGSVRVFGADARKRSPIVAGVMTYMAEAVKLPARMTLAQLEAYIAPLHAKWDGALAASLRERFALDPARKVGTLSRGEHMKAALLCALAPHPTLLLMDEPFTGMDVMVKDDLGTRMAHPSGCKPSGWVEQPPTARPVQSLRECARVSCRSRLSTTRADRCCRFASRVANSSASAA